MDAGLPDLMRDEIVRRYGDRSPRIGVGSCVATFPCPSRALGDVVVEADQRGVVVGITGMWHGHFDEGGPAQIVASCARFLDDLFADRIVVWVTHRNGKPAAGGCFYCLAAEMPAVDSGVPHDRRRTPPPPGARAATWSGPWPDDSPSNSRHKVVGCEVNYKLVFASSLSAGACASVRECHLSLQRKLQSERLVTCVTSWVPRLEFEGTCLGERPHA